MRLIDADALTQKESVMRKGCAYIEEINNAPTIDAEPIVRCKDCKHASECDKSVQYTRNEQNTVTIGYSPIEWCSRGERREL